MSQKNFIATFPTLFFYEELENRVEKIRNPHGKGRKTRFYGQKTHFLLSGTFFFFGGTITLYNEYHHSKGLFVIYLAIFLHFVERVAIPKICN